MKITTNCVLAIAAVLAAGTLQLRAADGTELYTEHCAKCHGDDGKGKTRLGESVELKTDLTDPAVQAKLKDEDILKAMKEGIKDKATGKKRMKPVEDVSDEDLQKLVAFVRTFKK